MDYGGAVVAEDLATGAFGLVNAAYFAKYWWQANGRTGRRFGAGAMCLISVATLVEALFSQGLFWSREEVVGIADGTAGLWALARVPLLLATVLISAIIVRREVA